MAAQDMTAWKRTLYEAIGREVQKRRNAAGLSSQAIATKIGCTYQQIQRIEAGDSSPVHYLVAIAQLLKCEVGDLIPHVPFAFKRIIGEADT